MFRQYGNSMSAAQIVLAMYDRDIPADIMAQALAEDERYAADPVSFEADLRKAAQNANAIQLAYCRSMVREKVAQFRRAKNDQSRDYAISGLRHWFNKYRAEQQSLRSATA